MKQTLVLIILLFSLNISANQRLDVRDFGAVGDGITKDTKAFQEAITQGAKEKRVVYIPGGEFYIGPLILFSNTSIELSDFAVIKGSTDTIDYKCTVTGKKLALLNADRANHIRISGRGIIEGNGDAPQFKTYNGDKRDRRPNLLVFNESSDIEIRDLTMKNSAAWMQHYYMCKGLRLFNLTIYNHVNMNNDGIDIDNCYDVVVSGCIVDSDDDAFCLKSTDNEGICQNITLTNCILASEPNSIIHFAAVFSPTPGIEGKLSLGSPRSAAKSGYCAGVKPYFSKTASGVILAKSVTPRFGYRTVVFSLIN